MPIFEPHPFDPTAFMSGQMISKIWLCEELERVIVDNKPNTIWIMGGWYASTNFLLRIRGKLPIRNCISFDMDQQATRGALILNETSIFLGQFQAHTFDINSLDFSDRQFGRAPDIVVNTSCEHIDDDRWFDAIPKGTIVVLQSNDMPHDDHSSNLTCVEDMQVRYPLSEVLFSGEKFFDYEEWSFSRFMTIGVK